MWKPLTELPPSDDGFTLLEVLFAFLILSTSLVVTSQSIALATRSLQRAVEIEKVRNLVGQLRTETMPGSPERRFARNGESNGLRWRIEAKPATQGSTAIIRISGAEGRRYQFWVLTPSSPKDSGDGNE